MASAPAHTPLIHDYHLLSYDSIDSTNEEAKRLAQGGGSHGAVIWAKRQTAGRGRMGREWVSPEGNLYVTALLTPNADIATCAQLSFIAAVAVCETLEAMVGESIPIRCKWPNDILLEGKKLGGILLESFVVTHEDGSSKRWVSVGVGVNIDSYPEHVMYPATCLRDAGVEIVSAKIVLSRFIYNFVHLYDIWQEQGFAPVLKSWLKRAYHIGKPIEVMIGDEAISGTFETVDSSGHLVIQQANGKRRTIHAGDVFFKDA
jgi:BirA family transcriptional regulator, biotin operon repressor / biotin---[acetyl-CoA-carboxylase] ligase